jgi:hypothetical protein
MPVVLKCGHLNLLENSGNSEVCRLVIIITITIITVVDDDYVVVVVFVFVVGYLDVLYLLAT